MEAQATAGIAAPLPLERLEAVARFVLDAEEVTAAELSVTLLSDAEIAELNEQYLEHGGPTDVISFPMESPDGRMVGDVYIGVDQALRQASELDLPIDEELLRLVVHGTLHVLGYDHPEGDERAGSAMYRRQEELLSRFLNRGARPA